MAEEQTRRVRRQQPRCPYCHDGLQDGLVVVCTECRAIYHPECAAALGSCGVIACQGQLPRERELLPLTGKALGTFDPTPLLVLAFGLTVIPFFVVLISVDLYYNLGGFSFYVVGVSSGVTLLLFLLLKRGLRRRS